MSKRSEEAAMKAIPPDKKGCSLWLMQKHGIRIHVMTIADRESETGYYYEVSLFVGKNWMARGFHNDYQYALYNALNELYHGRRRKD